MSETNVIEGSVATMPNPVVNDNRGVGEKTFDLWKEMGPDTSYQDLAKNYCKKYGTSEPPSAATISNQKRQAWPKGSSAKVNADVTIQDLHRVRELLDEFGSISHLLECVEEYKKLVPAV